MTINATFQSFSASAMRFSVGERPTTTSVATAPAAPTTPTTTAATDDTVTLSSAAQAEPATPAPTADPDGNEGAAETSLFTTLDADEDGAMTKDEFTSGALALLGRRGDHPRVHGNGDGDNGRRARGVPGLENRLEKAFDRVDANLDGAIDEGELDAALSRSSESEGATAEAAAPPAPEQPQPSAAFTFTSVTYVSVAVQRYTSLQEAVPVVPPTPAAEPDAA
jgi:hypothetical protein